MERTSFRRKLATLSSVALASASLFWATSAAADVTLLKSEDGGWEFYTNGRVNAFFSWAKGDGTPVAPLDATTNAPIWKYYPSIGGTEAGESEPAQDPIFDATGNRIGNTQGTIDSMRIRSGFVGNVLGFGLRRKLDATTKVSAYISIWSIVESVGRRKYFPNFADIREGYMKIEGVWGSFLAGKTLTLFDGGAGEADFLYLHGYGLGYPGSIAIQGPAAGMIGFGVLGPTFSGGLVYSTPTLAGIKLAAGIYDPASLTGSRLERTKAIRPEFELTVDEPLGNIGKVHAFLNGTVQKLYIKNEPDAQLTGPTGQTFGGSETAQGIGYGARVELGPVHLAAGGHRGTGLGIYFALQPSEQTYNDISQLRDMEGFFGIGQLSLKQFDINIGYGKTTVKPLARDYELAPGSAWPTYNPIHTQSAIAAAFVYHATDWLHLDVDVLHADYKWLLDNGAGNTQCGCRQQINFYNAGTTVTW